MFQLTATVSNGLVARNVTWLVTVFNVNDPPEFSQAIFETTINELVRDNQPILVLNVSDADDDTAETNFHLASVTVECKQMRN